MAIDILKLAASAPPEIRKEFQQREYPAGACIISPGQMPACCLYIIRSGVVEVQKESGDGNAIVVNAFSTGEVFGEVEIFSPEYKPYEVRAKTACSILVMNKETAFHWMREVFDFDLYLCEMLTRRMYVTSDSMSRIALLPIRERVLGCIWSYYSSGQLSSLTKEELVSQVRAPLRSVNRVVRGCIQQGIIDYRKKCFVVKDAEALERFSINYSL